MPLSIAGKIGLGSLGCVGLLIVGALFWFISALFWGLIVCVVWNTCGLYHAFGGASELHYFWEAVGIGALISLVAG